MDVDYNFLGMHNAFPHLSVRWGFSRGGSDITLVSETTDLFFYDITCT